MQATYTANLAAFFSQPSVEVLGSSTLAELRATTACISSSEYIPFVKSYAADIISLGSIYDTTIEERHSFCRAALSEGRASAWMDAELELSLFMGQEGNCDDLMQVPSI